MRSASLPIALLILIGLLAACGDDGAGDADDSGDDAPASSVPEPESDEPAEPVEPGDDAAETTTVPATDPDEDEPAASDGPVTFASLSDAQQRAVGGVCQAAVDYAETAGFSYSPDWTAMILAGESGVPALEAAFQAIGDVPDPGIYLEALGTTCDDIGWTSGG